MIWTIPNILTIGRLIAAPCVALVFVFFERPMADWLAFWIFVGAAVTDFFDGWLARKLNQVSALGKMLDPIADKAIVIIALITLFAREHASAVNYMVGITQMDISATIPVVLILFREVFISGVREFLGDIKLPVTWLAKIKTTVQMAAITMIFAQLPYVGLFYPHVYDCMIRPDCLMSVAPELEFLLQLPKFVGIALLWLAALLTIITGWEYFRKALAHLKEREAS